MPRVCEAKSTDESHQRVCLRLNNVTINVKAWTSKLVENLAEEGAGMLNLARLPITPKEAAYDAIAPYLASNVDGENCMAPSGIDTLLH